MSSSSLVILLLCGFHLVLLLPFSSENTSSQANGTRGAPWLWRCHHNFSKPFRPEESSIYWQSQDNSELVVYMYYKGKPDLKHQSQQFINRATIFPDQLHYGNLSLFMKELILKDDQTSLEVVFNSQHESTHLCQTTVYVAAPFQEPELEINQSNETATCSTKGGYPKPEIKWTSQDRQNQSERTLEQHEVQTTMTSEEDGTYSIISTANITGSQNVTCRVHNPTSNRTQSVSKDTTPETTPPENKSYLGIGVGVVACVCIVGLIIILVRCCIKNKNRTGSAAGGDSAEGNADEARSKMLDKSDESDPKNGIFLQGESVLYRPSVRRDDATDSASNEDSAAAAEAKQEGNDHKTDADASDEDK